MEEQLQIPSSQAEALTAGNIGELAQPYKTTAVGIPDPAPWWGRVRDLARITALFVARFSPDGSAVAPERLEPSFQLLRSGLLVFSAPLVMPQELLQPSGIGFYTGQVDTDFVNLIELASGQSLEWRFSGVLAKQPEKTGSPTLYFGVGYELEP